MVKVFKYHQKDGSGQETELILKKPTFNRGTSSFIIFQAHCEKRKYELITTLQRGREFEVPLECIRKQSCRSTNIQIRKMVLYCYHHLGQARQASPPTNLFVRMSGTLPDRRFCSISSGYYSLTLFCPSPAMIRRRNRSVIQSPKGFPETFPEYSISVRKIGITSDHAKDGVENHHSNIA